MTARLALICRHPLKGHGREELPEVELTPGAAMPWDRVWAVAHEAARLDPEGGWAPCMNFARGAKAPALMAIESRLDTERGLLTLRHPEAEAITFAPDDPAQHAAALDWLRRFAPEGRAAPAAIVRAKVALTDSAWPSVSILSLSGLRMLSQRLGRDLSPHRFRGNLWVEGWAPWEEFDLIGREIRIGEARLRIRERITRCKATMANPETGRIDADTLGVLEEAWGHTDFGVYAEVTGGGRIAPGDAVST